MTFNQKEYYKQWYSKNKQKMVDYMRAYRKAHPEYRAKENQRSLKWQQEHKEEYNARQRAWRAKKKEEKEKEE